MDFELLIALCTMWTASTLAIAVFFTMWFFNKGEAFHPHSVDVEQRHAFLAVSNSFTECKYDCAVKSISAFAAPRGSSASKLFSVSCVIVAIAGILGSARWHAVGDASDLELHLACAGFASLLLVAFFELDVVPERFLEDKLMVTTWLIQKLQKKQQHNKESVIQKLPFSLHYSNPQVLTFIRQSPGLYHLYEEDVYLQNRNRIGTHKLSEYHTMWFSLHLIGATGFATCCTAAVLLKDMAEADHAFVVGGTFFLFSGMGYMTGGYYSNYLPVLKYLRGWILVWNPFVREPHFMLRLEEALEDYLEEYPNGKGQQLKKKHSTTATASGGEQLTSGTNNDGLRQRPFRSSSIDEKEDAALSSAAQSARNRTPQEETTAANKADQALDSVFLRLARSHPRIYLRTVGHLLVISELIALLTPLVAMGLQWVTALCDGPPKEALIELLMLFLGCLKNNDCTSTTFAQSTMQHCILKQEKELVIGME